MVVAEGAIAERRFAAWGMGHGGMAYSGSALFVSNPIVRLVRKDRPSSQRPSEDWLLEFMKEF